MSHKYHLISSVTCPWVQRAVITLRAKAVAFDVTYINLRDKPDWFLSISPHGKVPVLLVDDVPLFESAAITEFLDEVVAPRLHPEDPIERARNRAWTDYIRDFAATLSGISYAKSKVELDERVAAAPNVLGRVETVLAARNHEGPYFNGGELSLVDASYAPFLQRFAVVDQTLQTGLLDQFPHLKAWSDTLLSDETVTGAVAETFPEEFRANLERRGTYAWSLIEAAEAAE